MKKVTVEEFQENWDEMIRKVEGGESIEITDGKGSAVMIPVEDEIYRIHVEHDDGC
jgi:antitoxin (DNA-binding transcriptional repressor) of toxin-antitoxin stability system